ncbi:NAD(P)-binding rossmann-fold protein, putative [Medicago truncatula]|uniref:NAD(P)-binding rossmann-fold protein, putative n=1 Tax=Medicago truncatula TaxID=3880 RepID=A0A072TM15_MEDTR|nr:NAD(P)-binding rossmann-fold protein, putative [Medicago truncatula]
MMKNNAKKLAEQDESVLRSSGPGCAATGSISKEDVAFVCVKALEFVPQTGLIFEVANGENKIPDWKECLATLMEKSSQPPLQ